ncbi:AbrB/MazE/SpoVT family DNA-binding domain-containing protein [Staphylococcus pettenkoferi]|uniref:AbrB/MazE/SpoVT family DNA-binding domain-containing protein n=2 Tax=Bacilli TaxID=91061 RepID=UPI002557825F|nr:AbrB/MazE/SpoVT family DNA-binding domain-containing protein [Staphylococcus pettenkoferi]MDK7284467.1 AbrB/MazE/SpoVT family DNA-binding domain-containing protein [Staphylococcus pettenkoferi]
MAVTSTRKLRRLGDSRVLTIPEEVIEELDVQEGQKVAFRIENGKVMIEAVDIERDELEILEIANDITQQYDQVFKDLVER